MAGNDQIAFYSAVPGYYPSTASTSPLWLVAYRVNSNPASPSYNKLEWMGKGLVWNGVSTTGHPSGFCLFQLHLLRFHPRLTPLPLAESRNLTSTEVIGPDVFRLESYYLLRRWKLPGIPCGNTVGLRGKWNARRRSDRSGNRGD